MVLLGGAALFKVFIGVQAGFAVALSTTESAVIESAARVTTLGAATSESSVVAGSRIATSVGWQGPGQTRVGQTYTLNLNIQAGEPITSEPSVPRNDRWMWQELPSRSLYFAMKVSA